MKNIFFTLKIYLLFILTLFRDKQKPLILSAQSGAVGDKLSGQLGKVKFGTAKTIASATYDAGVVTINFTAVHGFVAKERILIAGCVGMTDLNKSFTILAAPDTDTITVTLTTSQTWSSGGTAIKIIEVTNWELTKTADVIDTKDSNDAATGWGSNIPSGWKNFSGKFEGFIYAGTLPPGMDSSVAAIFAVNNLINWSGTIILTSEAVVTDVLGKAAVKVSYNCTGTGALTKADATT
jgi:hypothetical protein